jgi:RNA polymerase sigma factor (sigma-70 family)
MTPRLALRQRPEAAFESLYKRHVRDVYGYALAVLGSPADAEDVTQTTFLNAYRAFEGGERPRKPRSWLVAIAHNVCLQRFRQASRRPREVELDDGVAGVEESDAASAQDITRALQALPFNQRSALVMRELEGRSQAEIADALGVSVSAVETLIFRARRGVREQLESALSCGEAARAISRQLDRGSSRAQRAELRAHLRQCSECARFARQARARRGALRRLGALPLPASLASWSGGFGGAGGVVAAAPASGLGLKLLAGTATLVLAAGASDQVRRHAAAPSATHAAKAAANAASNAATAVPGTTPASQVEVPAQAVAANRAPAPGARAKPGRTKRDRHAMPSKAHRGKSAKRGNSGRAAGVKPAKPVRAPRAKHVKANGLAVAKPPHSVKTPKRASPKPVTPAKARRGHR